MAVVTDFVGVPLAGLPDSFNVQFTDLSTGGANKWWWDFGDGETSTEQHPLHTYNGEFGDKFTVTLKSFLGGSENNFGNISMHTYDSTGGGTFSTMAAAYADILLRSPFRWYGPWPLECVWSADGTGTDEESPLYNFALTEPFATLSFPADSGAGPSQWRLYFSSHVVSLQDGRINNSLGGSQYIAGGPAGQFQDVTGMNGQEIAFTAEKNLITVTPPQAPFNKSGAGLQAQLREIVTADAADIDSTTKVDYIQFGAPPIADFTGTPLVGPNNLEVQFTNLSTPANGLPTTYQWLKRVAGSGDAYVEFSTETHPLHIFSK